MNHVSTQLRSLLVSCLLMAPCFLAAYGYDEPEPMAHPSATTLCVIGGQVAAVGYLWYRHTHQKQPVRTQPSAAQPLRLAALALTGPVTTTDKFHDALQQCLTDDTIAGILLKIDAEWGTMSICEAMFRELQRAAQQKPIVTLVETSCCREPYLIATAAHRIIANEHATIGKIGTSLYFASVPPEKSAEKAKAKNISFFYAGRYTSLGETHHQMTPHEQQLIAAQLELHYQQMCASIAQQRNLDLDALESWADGKPFLGVQAQILNLIDEVGTLSNAYDAFNELLATKAGAATAGTATKHTFKLVPFTI